MQLPLLVLAVTAFGAQDDLPLAEFGSGWGVNIHFTQEGPGELKQIREAGFRWVRMDLMWSQIERMRGVYDFSQYDRLVRDCEREGLRILFILDYGNALYHKDSPRTPSARRAFAAYAKEAVKRYRGKGIVWEMWNEPNIKFWKPEPNVQDYIALAMEVGKTIESVAPGEIQVGPATSGFDWAFLESCFKAGLLRYWDGVTIHPYRPAEPETVLPDWAKLRHLVDRYSPNGKQIALMSGEWGYSDIWSGMSQTSQGEYMVRQYLANLAAGVNFSIWYDWKNDGTDPKDPEHNFGIVDHQRKPKSAYQEALRVSRELAGFRLLHRLQTSQSNLELLTFAKGSQLAYVAWSKRGGGALRLPTRVAGKESVSVGSRPETILADMFDPAARELLSWRPQAQPPQWRREGESVSAKEVAAKVGDARGATAIRSRRLSNGSTVREEAPWFPRQPLDLVFVPSEPGQIKFRLLNPTGQSFAGELISDRESLSVDLADFQTAETFTMDRPKSGRIRLRDGASRAIVLERAIPGMDRLFQGVPKVEFVAEGDAKVEGSAKATVDGSGIRLEYSSKGGWKYFTLEPKGDAAAPFEKAPSELSMEVEGNGSGDLLRMRFTDATGQTFQPEFGRMDWRGWRPVTFKLDASAPGRWGGANDGVVHYPIRITSVILIERPGRAVTNGAVRIRNVTLSFPGT